MTVDWHQHLHALIPPALDDWGLPGLAVSIVQGGAIVYSAGFGVTAVDRPEPIDGDTIFAAGSITKAFTATAIGLLVDEGKLNWDDKVQEYLPDFQLQDAYASREMLVRDLLCHRSGLPTWGGDFIFWGSTYNADDIYRRLRHIPPISSFRGAFGYSNMMYLVAGRLLEKVSGQSWADFVGQRLLAPLGMTRSSLSTTALAGQSNVARPHMIVGGAVTPVPYREMDNMAPAGCLNTTVNDLAQWLKLQLANGEWAGETLVPAAVLAETRRPHTILGPPPAAPGAVPATHFNHYALGWFVNDYHGRLQVSHGGGIDGMLAVNVFLPDADLGIAILSNGLPNGLYGSLARHIMEIALDVPRTAATEKALANYLEAKAKQAEAKEKAAADRAAGSRPALPLAAYSGVYHNDLYGPIEVKQVDDELELALSAHPQLTGRLTHWDFDTFTSRYNDPMLGDGQVTFTLDGRGGVASFRTYFDPSMLDTVEYVFRREANPSPALP